MRYLKPHFYDKFVCTAGDCPDTCCAGWQIMIDDASLEKYKNVQGEFGKRLHGSVNWEEECFCFNAIFNADVYDILFNGQSPFSPVKGGKLLFESVMDV